MDSTKYRDMRWYSEEEVQQITDDIERAVTIPVNTEIEAEHRVYDFTELKEILEASERITVSDCGCKTAYHNCKAPTEVCISINKEAERTLENDLYNVREIDIDEAIEVLKKSHEAGLVPMAYVFKGEETPGLVCNCCPCCCHTLGSLVRNGIHTQILTSKYIAADDSDKCTDCGICIDRCVFQARWMNKGKLVYDQTKCFGCGLCASTCPTEVISLTLRNQ
jgi:Pyruvate/2-oxoacid:ferredoxin oxidoreductase delta subunit